MLYTPFICKVNSINLHFFQDNQLFFMQILDYLHAISSIKTKIFNFFLFLCLFAIKIIFNCIWMKYLKEPVFSISKFDHNYYSPNVIFLFRRATIFTFHLKFRSRFRNSSLGNQSFSKEKNGFSILFHFLQNHNWIRYQLEYSFTQQFSTFCWKNASKLTLMRPKKTNFFTKIPICLEMKICFKISSNIEWQIIKIFFFIGK